MASPAPIDSPRADADAARAPSVWVLLGKGTGGNGQMLSLAQALGWPFESKKLVHNPLNVVPNLLLGASKATVDSRRSSPLQAPWPDLVIGASRRSAPVALWIRKQSGGRTRLVHLLHAQTPLEQFDLIITLPQYRLPDRPNVLHNTGPLNLIDPASLDSARSQWVGRLAELPRPYTALIVGGNSSSYVLDPATAARLGREASERAAGGSLLVTTSPRTPPESTDALFAAVDGPSHLYRWKRDDPDNPYKGFLALADRFIVTVDSASLAIEACATGRPVEVFEWPRKGAPTSGHDDDGLGARAYERLLYLGLVKPPRDFDAFHRALRERGLTTRLGDRSEPPPRRPLDDLEQAVARIRQLFPADSIPGRDH